MCGHVCLDQPDHRTVVQVLVDPSLGVHKTLTMECELRPISFLPQCIVQVQRPPLKVGEVRDDSLPAGVCKRLTGSFLVKITSTDNSHLGYLAEVDCDGIVPVASDAKSITDTDQILRQQRLQQG